MRARTVVRVLLKTLLPVLVLVLAGVFTVKLVQSRQPPPKRERPSLGPLVRVSPVEPEDVPVEVHAFGTVRARREVDLTPQVSGVVVEMSPHLVSGGFVEAGELLVKIDPRDYELAVEAARAEVARAAYELTRAEEEAAVARREWELLQNDSPSFRREEPPAEDSLLFRGPQLNLARANLEAARARLAEAELDLSRIELRAPFDGRVREETVDVGQYVASGRSVARIYGTDAAEIVFPVPDGELAWIGGARLLQGVGSGPRVTVRARHGGVEHQWPGRVVRTDGVIDPQTRMVHLIVEVQDPYREGRAPLTVGLFVEGVIQGSTLRDVYAVPRHAVHPGDTVWLAREGVLQIRPVEVARRTDTHVYLTGGIDPGSRVVVSRIDAVADGMAIRPVEE